MRRSFSRFLWIALLFLFGVIVVNTILFPSRQIPVKPIEVIAIDDEVLERLSEAIQIPTISDENGIDTAAFQSIFPYVPRTYPLVDSLLTSLPVNKFSQVLKWQGKNAKLQPVLFIAHLDVLPITDDGRDLWKYPPFGGNIAEGFIWGRGTLNNKSSVFGWLETIEQLLTEEYQPQRTVYFAFGHDGESSGAHGAGSIARYFQRYNINFVYVLDEGQMIIKEALPGLDAPLAIVGIAEKGYLSLALNVQLPNRIHSSTPPKETAITIIGDAIKKLQDHPFPMKIDGATKALLQHAGPEMAMPFKAVSANLNFTGGLLKRILRRDPASAASLRTTMVPIDVQSGIREQVLPTEARAIIEFRILPGESVASVQAFVRKTINDPRIDISIHRPGVVKEPTPLSATNSFGYQVLHKTIRQVIPEAVIAPGLVLVSTDSYQYLEVTDDVYRFLPVTLSREELKGLHGINERLSIENYRQLIRFYRQLILNSCR